MRKIFLIIFIAGCLSAILNQAFAQEPELIYEQCYVNKSRGVQTGFSCITQRKKVESNKTYIETVKHIELKFKRLDSTVSIIQDQTFLEDLEGNPVAFAIKKDNIGEKVDIKGSFIDSDTASVDYNINGVKSSREVDFDDRIIFPYAIDKLYETTDKNVVKYSTIEPSLDLRLLKVKAKMLDPEKLEDGSLKGVYTKYRVHYNILPNSENHDWRDSSGRLVKSRTSLFDMEEIAVNKSEIQEVSGDFDIFTESFVEVNRDVQDRGGVDQAIYKVSVNGVPPEGIFINDERQRVIQTTEEAAYLKVKSENYNKINYPYPFDNSGYYEYLRSGPFIMSDSTKIRKVADRLKEGEIDAFKLAKKMKSWVFANLDRKDFSTDFANAVSALETRSGDCTEHSILLAALLRAAGIPSKIVVGLVYTNSPRPAFVYHMWVKAYVGKWVNLDPSFPYENFTPLHLAMGESAMNDFSSRGDINLKVLESINNLEIEILNVSKPVIANSGSPSEVKININNNRLSSEGVRNIRMDRERLSAASVDKINLPGQVDINYMRNGYYHYSQGELALARENFKKFYRQISPQDDLSKMRLALKLISMGFINFANEVIGGVGEREIWQKKIDEINYFYIPKIILNEKEELIAAEALYKLDMEEDPAALIRFTNSLSSSDYVNFIRAKAFFQRKEYLSAERELLEAIKLNQDNLLYKLELLKVYIALNENNKASRKINALSNLADSLNIHDKEFWKELNAQDNWLKVKLYRDDINQGRYYKAKYYAVKGDYRTAVEILYEISFTAKKAYIDEFLGELYYELDTFEEAKKSFTSALGLEENRVRSLFGLGNVAFVQGEPAKALAYYEEALKIAPRNIEILLAAAKVHKSVNEPERAYTYFKKVLETDKNNPDVIYNIGVILSERGEQEKAEKLLKNALSADPLESLAWLDLAKVRLVQEDYKTALRYLNALSYIDDNNPYYYYYTGVILKKNNQLKEAENYFKKAIELKPGIVEEVKQSKKQR